MFNLRHASARNVIEHIFGVLKRQFRILLIAPEYNLNIQAQIPSALCAIHNFIRMYDILPDTNLDNSLADDPDSEDLDVGPFTGDEEDDVDAGCFCDQIAEEMWEDYVHVLAERCIEAVEFNSKDSDVDVTDSE